MNKVRGNHSAKTYSMVVSKGIDIEDQWNKINPEMDPHTQLIFDKVTRSNSKE